MSYRNLEIWKLARDLAVDIHRMTMHDVPKFEMYEEGAQIRRSIKSVRSNIVEGYGRRRYKQEYIKFLTYALSSCDETTDHLEMLKESGSLQDLPVYESLHDRLQMLGKKLTLFIRGVEATYNTLHEERAEYIIQNRVGAIHKDPDSENQSVAIVQNHVEKNIPATSTQLLVSST